MGGLRAAIESDLYETLEGDFGLPIELISPSGVRQTKSANNPTEDLSGQIVFNTMVHDPVTGLDVVMRKPVVSLRISSLTTVPDENNLERWVCRAPESNLANASMVTYRLSRAPEDGKTIGVIRFYLERIVQAP